MGSPSACLLCVLVVGTLAQTFTPPPFDQVFDVVIVGGGLAGLSASRRIHEVDPTATVLIVEGRQSAGGRVMSVGLNTSQGQKNVDIGSQWIGPNHDEILRISQQMGLTIENQAMCGERTVVVERAGRHRRAVTWSPDLHLSPSVNEVLSSPSLDSLSSLSIAQFLAQDNVTQADRDTVNRLLQTFYDAPENEISAAQVALTASSDNETVDDLLGAMGHGRGLRVREGLGQLINKMTEGTDIVYGENVTEIAQDDSGLVHITSASGQMFHARQVIVAMGPALATSINFQPQIPGGMAKFMNSYRARGVASYFAVAFTEPFWRAQNKSGQVIYAGEGPLLWMTTFDTTENDQCATASGPGILWGIAHFAEDIPPEQRFQHYVETIQKSFETTATPTDITDHQFCNDAFSRGSIGVLPPTTDPELQSFIAALYSVDEVPYSDHVHFTGAEYSKVSMGMMNGAVAHGRLVADKVVAQLGGAEAPAVVVGNAVNMMQRDQPQSHSTRSVPLDSFTTPFEYQTSTMYPPSSEEPTPLPIDSSSVDYPYSTSTQYPENAFGTVEPVNSTEMFAQNDAVDSTSSTEFPYSTSTQYAEGVFTDASTQQPSSTTEQVAGGFQYSTSTQYPDSTQMTNGVVASTQFSSLHDQPSTDNDFPTVTPFHYETSTQYAAGVFNDNEQPFTQSFETAGVEGTNVVKMNDALNSAPESNQGQAGPVQSVQTAIDQLEDHVNEIPIEERTSLAAQLSGLLNKLLNFVRRR